MKIKILILLCMVAALPSCSNKRPDMKSPCVGTEDSPCGPRRSVNSWWMA